MKTKRKEKKEKKKRQEAKRKTFRPDPSSGSSAHQAMGESLTSRPRGKHSQLTGIFIIKTFEPY